MLVCLICGFETELDDACVVLSSKSRCICLRCFDRETARAAPCFTKILKRELDDILSSIA